MRTLAGRRLQRDTKQQHDAVAGSNEQPLLPRSQKQSVSVAQQNRPFRKARHVAKASIAGVLGTWLGTIIQYGWKRKVP